MHNSEARWVMRQQLMRDIQRLLQPGQTLVLEVDHRASVVKSVDDMGREHASVPIADDGDLLHACTVAARSGQRHVGRLNAARIIARGAESVRRARDPEEALRRLYQCVATVRPSLTAFERLGRSVERETQRRLAAEHALEQLRGKFADLIDEAEGEGMPAGWIESVRSIAETCGVG